MFNTLFKLANRLDQKGLPGYANMVDCVLSSFAGGNDSLNILELMKLKPDAKKSLLEAVTFDLESKPGAIKAVPDINVDLYNFEIDLSELQDSPDLHRYLSDDSKNALFQDIPIANEYDVDYVPEKNDFKGVDESLEKALNELKREDFIDPGARSEEGEVYQQQYQQRLRNLEKARQQKEFNQVIPGALEAVEQGNFTQQQLEGRPSMQNTEAEVRALLVKMADDFDKSGNHDLAESIDTTLKSLSARPKAPLKQLDDDVKKNLIMFVHDSDQSTAKSIKGLKELFRRLRYFDLADSVKETGLDRVVKDMEKTQGCIGGAKSKLYELMMGRKPSVQALKDFVGDTGESDTQSSLDFFDKHMEKEEVDLGDEEDMDEDILDEDDEEDMDEDILDEDEEDEEDLEGLNEGELSKGLEEELEEFLAGLEDDEEDE